MKSPNNSGYVLGLAGNAACGKDFVASVFQDYGYFHISSSDLVREEIARRGLTTSRLLQTEVANSMRELHGPGYFVNESVRRAQEVAPSAGKLLISGIYAVCEGETIVNTYGGSIVCVLTSRSSDADIRARYERLTSRADGPRDNISLEDFIAAYTRENNSKSDLEPNVSSLMKMARFTIVNSPGSSRDEIVHQVQEVIQEIET